jgi:hypothetical protein
MVWSKWVAGGCLPTKAQATTQTRCMCGMPFATVVIITMSVSNTILYLKAVLIM